MDSPFHPPSHIKYRTDIDGLRAVAVLLVVADHLRTHLSGGYIGVDVFFVISGYLISAVILKEMASGTFSIVNFYERRIRRIFPALIVLLLATCVPAWVYLFPSELRDFSRSLLAATFSVSNLWFFHQAGYFDAPSAFKPLLHTWSLAVEEQFYIFFPLFLVLVRRFAREHLKAAIVGIAGVTFVLALFYVRRDATAAFFLAPLRAWELLLGTILSQRYLPPLRSAAARNLATAAGFLLILVPALRYTATTPFPGLAAMPPCVGAVLIIAGGEYGSSLVGRALSLRPVVFVGLISYSLYLWHWPVLAFQNIAAMVSVLPESDRRLKLLLLAISLALGALSWRLVETPFRSGRLRPARRTLFAINAAGILAITGVAAAFLLTGGLPSRFPPDALRVAEYLDYDRRPIFREGSCFLSSGDSLSSFRPSTCLAEDPARKNVLIMGDSQAAQLWFGLQKTYPGVNFLQATAFACPLLLDAPQAGSAGCGGLSAYLHTDFLLRHHVDAVLYGGRWIADDVPNIEREMAWMYAHDIPVVLFGPMTEYDQPFPRVLAAALRAHRLDRVPGHLTAPPRTLDAQLAILSRERWHVHYISYFSTMCRPDCPNFAGPDVPVLFDEHHLTAAGSILFAGILQRENGLQIPSGTIRSSSAR
jgi:peptidoglycan/LPS O-acetylase OafA/YrhL